jgi:anti-anti-sigma factor
MSRNQTGDAFTIERHGEVSVVCPSLILEHLDSALVTDAAALMLEPLLRNESPQVVIDLGQLPSFGTPFLAMLIRCWKRISECGGTMVISNVSTDVRQLLKITKFDTLWPIYEDRSEAVNALISD